MQHCTFSRKSFHYRMTCYSSFWDCLGPTNDGCRYVLSTIVGFFVFLGLTVVAFALLFSILNFFYVCVYQWSSWTTYTDTTFGTLNLMLGDPMAPLQDKNAKFSFVIVICALAALCILVVCILPTLVTALAIFFSIVIVLFFISQFVNDKINDYRLKQGWTDEEESQSKTTSFFKMLKMRHRSFKEKYCFKIKFID